MSVAAVSFYSVVLFVHVAAAVIAFGALFAYPVALSAGRGRAAFHLAQLRVGRRLLTPAATVLFAAGIYLAVDGPYDFGDPWIGVGVLILLVFFGTMGAFLAPRERRLAELADAGGPEYDRLAGQVLRATLLLDALVLVALFLMVTKPGA